MAHQNFVAQVDTAPPTVHLVEEINHRVVNEYAEAIALVSVAARRSESAEAKETLEEVVQRLLAHAAAHRALLPPEYHGELNLADYVGDLCAALIGAAPTDNQVRLTLAADDIWLDSGRCWRIGLILSELVRNAIRHGLAGGPGAIVIRLVDDADAVLCFVNDNGSGPKNSTPGRGLRIVKSLADEIGGQIEWRFSGRGCLASLQLPKVREPI